MNRRLELQAKLESILGESHVYFQPPTSVKISYPCFVYRIGSGDAKYANDMTYRYINSYDVLYITKRPNLDMIDQVLRELPMCRLTNTYCSEGLNHYAFTLYY